MPPSNVSSVTNFFSTANEGFTTTLGSTITAGATTVPFTAVTNLTNGTIFVGIIEPGLPNQQVFTGIVNTGGSEITGVIWTRAPLGGNVGHVGGVTIVDYVSGTDWNMAMKGILVDHTQNGYHSSLHDANDKIWLGQTATTGAVNYINNANAATGNYPTLSALGSDTNIDINVATKGTGVFRINGTSLGAWTSWTPSWTNFTPGNSTISAKYVQIGKTVSFVINITQGSSGAVGTIPQFSLPVTAVATIGSFFFPLGTGVGALSTASTAFVFYIGQNSTTTAQIFSGTIAGQWVGVSATTPFTWATGSVLSLSGSYQAA